MISYTYKSKDNLVYSKALLFIQVVKWTAKRVEGLDKTINLHCFS